MFLSSSSFSSGLKRYFNTDQYCRLKENVKNFYDVNILLIEEKKVQSVFGFCIYEDNKSKLKIPKNSMKELIIAFGLFLFIEGIIYALFPSKMKNMLKKMETIKDSQLRTGGLIFAIIGFFIVWYIKN